MPSTSSWRRSARRPTPTRWDGRVVGQTPGATQRGLNPGFSERIRNSRRTGYTRIRGALANLGHDIARNTVKRILHDHGIERWRRHYNEERPHISLGGLTPAEFKAQIGTTEFDVSFLSRFREVRGGHESLPSVDNHTLCMHRTGCCCLWVPESGGRSRREAYGVPGHSSRANSFAKRRTISRSREVSPRWRRISMQRVASNESSWSRRSANVLNPDFP